VRAQRLLSAVEVHAEGEQASVYLGGVFDLPGATMADKLRHVNEVDDTLRRLLCFEPRGKAQMSVDLVFPPTDPDADAAFLVLQADRAHAMSGSNTICVVTALLETGTLPMHEPQSTVVLETAAGLVRVAATCRDGRCERVTLDGVPSFVEALDVALQVPGYGEVTVDVAYGGCYYVLVDAATLGLRLRPEDARALVDAGTAVHRAAREAITVRHPTIPAIDFVSYVMLTGDDDPAAGQLRGTTVLPPGRLDRSPCGTGSSARLACMAARGQVAVGDRFTARSVIDSVFEVEVIGQSCVGDRLAILPRISGRGFVHGLHQTVVDPDDPYPTGFVLSDTWGPDLTATGTVDRAATGAPELAATGAPDLTATGAPDLTATSTVDPQAAP
jgi:proline racemase